MTDATATTTHAGSVRSRARVLALLAGAAVALAGGLVWAGVVIATQFDIGILAVAIGAGTGLAIKHVLGDAVRTADRLVGGALAAGGIVVGKYVIFVHAVRVSLGRLLAAQGLSVGYLDSRQMSIFMHNFQHIVRPIYLLWIGLAFLAALRVTRAEGWRRSSAPAASAAPAEEPV